MSLQILVQDSQTGREFPPVSQQPVKDVYKNVAPLDPVDVSAAGRQFGATYFPDAIAPFAIQFEVITKSGTSADPVLSLGLTGTDANLLSEITLFGMNTYGAVGSVFTCPISGMVPKIVAGTPINLNVVTGSGGTLTLQIKVIGTEPSV